MPIDKVIDDCREFMKLADDAEGGNRRRALSDLRFAAGDQWPTHIQTQRELENRPCLTINKTDSFVRQVVNNMRQQRPRMIPHPVGNGADVETAEVIKGLLRHIEANSNADVAYDTAADFQVRMGWGYWRVTHRYIDEKSFDQDIFVDPIDNPFTVYFDPLSVLPDGSDAEQCVVTEMVRRDWFKKKYPKADPMEFNTVSAGDDAPQWADEKQIRIAEYWRVEKTPDTLVLYTNGWQGFKSQIDPEAVKMLNLQVQDERESFRRCVKVSKLTARDVLETKEWAGRWIPIIPVYGCKLNVDGQVERYGMVKNLIDPARMYNFWRTSEAEIVALAPKAPWLMAEGQDEGHEQEWDSANTKSYSRLVYKPKADDSGQTLPPPQRMNPQQIPAANVNAATGAAEDMKAVAGIYDASLGDREQDPSGIALSRHQSQSDTSNFHYYDNITRSLRFTGKVILDLIPKIYPGERVMRIIGDDGEPTSITINQRKKDEAGAIQKVLNDVTVGTYGIVMDTGPGYATKRMETAENMMKLLTTPVGEKVAQVADDIIVRHMDWTGSKELADRLAAANPLAQQEQLPDFPEEAQAMIKQLQGQLQQSQQAIQHLQLEIKYRGGIEQMKQDAETNREHMRQTVKAHDIDNITATRRHDTEVKALSAQNVEEIRAMAQLLLKHIDGTHLEREIAIQEQQLLNKSNEDNPPQ